MNKAFKKSTPKRFVLILMALATSIQVHGQIRAGEAFLKMNPGTRAQGVANSLAGSIDHMHAIYTNPATVGFYREQQWAASYNKWITDVYNASFLYGFGFRNAASRHTRLAVAVSYLGVPAFNSSDASAAASSAKDALFTLSLGQTFGAARRFGIGTSLKYFVSELDQYQSKTPVLDAGALFRTQRFRVDALPGGFFDWGIFSMGLSLLNAGPAIKYISAETPLPMTIQAGAALNLGTHNGFQFMLASDYKKVRDEGDGVWSIGTEFSIGPVLSLRSGYHLEDNLLGHFSFGTSIRLDRFVTSLARPLSNRNTAFRLDLATLPGNDFFKSPYRGTANSYTVRPAYFEFIAPDDNAEITENSVQLSWESTHDPDLFDSLRYCVVASMDSLAINDFINYAKKEQRFEVQNSKKLHFQWTTQPALKYTALTPGTHYWTVFAVDRDDHFRIAQNGKQPISKFLLLQPDIEITTLNFKYSPWITEDDHQGQITFSVTNIGKAEAKDFILAMEDSTAELLASNSGRDMDASAVPESWRSKKTTLQPGEKRAFALPWRTTKPGLHHIKIKADIDNVIAESNTGNNSLQAGFYTIPKGRVQTRDTTEAARIEKSILNLPFVAAVFFDSSGSNISEEQLLDPETAPLLVLAERLKKNPDRSIALQGFIDPNSDEQTLSLADERAQAVENKLLQLGVGRNQISIISGLSHSKRGVPRDPTDARWVFQERRRVTITTEREAERLLFKPIKKVAEYMDFIPVPFHLDIKSAVAPEKASMTLAGDHFSSRTEVNDAARKKNLNDSLFCQLNMNGGDGTPYDSIQTGSHQFSLVDQMGREFMTRRQHFYVRVTRDNIKHRLSWPLKFDSTRPFYSFYMPELYSQAKHLLANKAMRASFIGHACAVGPHEINQRLSKKRAEAFRRLFIKGIPQKYKNMDLNDLLSRLDPVAGHGELRPITFKKSDGQEILIGNNNSPLGRTLNRRIDIIIYSNK